jgi:hypothetical protein
MLLLSIINYFTLNYLQFYTILIYDYWLFFYLGLLVVINGYKYLFYWWLLMVILLMIINAHYWLFY